MPPHTKKFKELYANKPAGSCILVCEDYFHEGITHALQIKNASKDRQLAKAVAAYKIWKDKYEELLA